MTVPIDLIEEAQRLDPEGAFLYLFELRLNPTQTIYIARNNESVVFDGNTYLPFPVNVSGEEQDTDGNISEITVSVDNVNGKIGEWMDQSNGLTESVCIVHFGNTQHLATPSNWLSTTFAITAATRNDLAAQFTLGASPLYDYVVPFYRYQRGLCRHAYRSDKCGYVGLTRNISGVENTTPIRIITTEPNLFKNGGPVTVSGVDPSVDGTYTMIAVNANTLSLFGTSAAGAFGSGGTVSQDLPSCDLTFYGANGCRAHANTLNFGGFPSVRRQA